jgi:hypothetical protein
MIVWSHSSKMWKFESCVYLVHTLSGEDFPSLNQIPLFLLKDLAWSSLELPMLSQTFKILTLTQVFSDEVILQLISCTWDCFDQMSRLEGGELETDLTHLVHSL